LRMSKSDNKRIYVLPGDGIGPEVVRPAISILKQVAERGGFELSLEYGAIGGHALDESGTPLAEATLESCRRSDAVLLGAVGGPKWDDNPQHLRPEKGLLAIRKGLKLYGNLRPVRLHESLIDCSTLKPEVISGVDLLVVRELTGGLYFCEPRGISGEPGKETGTNTMAYQHFEVERIARKAFQLARGRRKKVTSIDKANVLEVSRLWRQVVEEVHADFSEIELGHQYVDNCAMQMVLRPTQFDVVVTENTFGDILSDIGGVLTGSIGTLPSASVGDGPALYEPVHGSAPDIEGKNIANPIGMIECVAMMFEISFERADLAACINRAVDKVLADGYRTADLGRAGGKIIGTIEFAERVQEEIAASPEKAHK
jgi:3-isopropylmalate dehydrogenase